VRFGNKRRGGAASQAGETFLQEKIIRDRQNDGGDGIDRRGFLEWRQ
jgi:hypothetical protein